MQLKKVIKQQKILIPVLKVTDKKIAGYGSGSVSQRYISADPDSDQNVILVSIEDKIPSALKNFTSQSFPLPVKKTSQEV
jgi:hypothetical protein